MNNKVVYIITTYNCSACKCIKNIFEEIKEDNSTFTLLIIDFKDVPEFIKQNINLTDFPITIFVRDNIIKYNFIGTLSKRKIIKLMENINF